ncbi:sulfite exporter TauE/SafE family protein, partial [Actinomadura sp. KC06]|uniref:TSUP family transporter n=1 Tax=Actinomadura sp. KC06 TaxID=2530369 RepID=UPI0010D09960
ALVGGMFGVGGPMLCVPLLVALGVPVLPALAAAQAQSVVIAGVGTAGYAAAGAVDWPLAAVVGVPELAGVVLGWMIARAVPARALTGALVVSLLTLAPYVALHG